MFGKVFKVSIKFENAENKITDVSKKTYMAFTTVTAMGRGD